MAAAPPIYDFKYNWDDYQNKAKGQLSPMYEQQVNDQKAAIPLIQEQYKLLSDQIIQEKADTEASTNKKAANAIGNTLLRNATMGISDSSEQSATERNVMDDTNTTLASLAKAISTQLSMNENQKQGKIQNVNSIVNALRGEETQKVLALASQLLGSDKETYDTRYNMETTNFWKQIEQANAERQFQLQREGAAADQRYRNASLALEQSKLGAPDRGITGTVGSEVLFNQDGTQKDQNAVYRDLIKNQAYYKSIGVDVASLWKTWEAMKAAEQAKKATPLNRLANNPKY